MDYAVAEVSLQQTYKPVMPPMIVAGRLPIIKWMRLRTNIIAIAISIASTETFFIKNDGTICFAFIINFSISTKLTLGRVIVYSLPIRAGMLIMSYIFVFVELCILFCSRWKGLRKYIWFSDYIT